MPNGCEASGSVTVCTTARLVGLMTLMLATLLFTTQMRPSGAIATLRGAAPTAISVSARS